MNFEFDLTITVSVIMVAIMGVFTWFRTRRHDIDERFDKVTQSFKDGSKRMDRHDLRISGVEQTLKTMPGKDDMHQLQLQLAEVVGSMRELRAVMDGNANVMGRIETIVSRHEEHLLDGSKK